MWFTNYIFVLLPGFTGSWETLNIKLQIAQTHAVFNISNTIIQLPMVAVLAFMVTKLIPDSKEEDLRRVWYIDKRFLNNPAFALSQATRETLRMGELAREAFSNAIEYFNTRNHKLYQRSLVLEESIDRLEREITDYIVLVSQKNLTSENSHHAYIILQALNDIERVGDHCENIIEQADYASKTGVVFSGEAQAELQTIIDMVDETLALAMQLFDSKDKETAYKVIQNEIMIDHLQAEYRKAHIRRLNEGICNGNNGAVFLDMLSNLERIGDHCNNIAHYILDDE
jgi:phosphate:Na+ symporter